MSNAIEIRAEFTYHRFLRRPLHLAAPLGMIDVVETLLTKGASITAVDSKGLSPPLACAANEDVAMCLAMILSVFLATPANSEARRSICSLGSLKLSDSSTSFSSRLSDVSVSDVTFTVGSTSTSGPSGGEGGTASPDRSHSTEAVDDPSSSLPNAFPDSSPTKKKGAAVAAAAAVVVAGDVNHNTSNGTAEVEQMSIDK